MNYYNKYIERLSYIGNAPELPDFIRGKLWITNLAIFLGIIFSFFYICRSLLLSQLSSIVFLSLTVFVVFCFLLLANIYGGIVYSRYLVVMTPVIANAILIILSSTPKIGINEALVFGSLCYALFSFIIIDFREKKFLILTLVSCMSVILSAPILSTLVGLDSKIIIKNFDSLEKAQMFINFFLLGIIATYLIRDYSLKRQEVIFKKEKMKKDINTLRQSINYKELLLADRFRKLNENIRFKSELGEIQQIRQIVIKNDNIVSAKKLISLLYTRLFFINMAYHSIYKNEQNDSKAELRIVFYKDKEQKNVIHTVSTQNENLVGQVIRNQKHIYISNLPDNYSNIIKNEDLQSNELEIGRHLYIYPIVYNTKLFGILEFTCYKELTKNQFGYLEIAAKTAGQEMFLNNKG